MLYFLHFYIPFCHRVPWYFEIVHCPGKSNAAANATSRHPVASIDSFSTPNLVNQAFVRAVQKRISGFTSISWTQLAQETAKDPALGQLSRVLPDGFNDHHQARNPELAVYWPLRHSLFVEDGVIIYNDRAVIPSNLRDSCLSTILHSAHQGVSGMESRARSLIFWPGMNDAISVLVTSGETVIETRHHNRPYHHLRHIHLQHRSSKCLQITLISVITTTSLLEIDYRDG